MRRTRPPGPEPVGRVAAPVGGDQADLAGAGEHGQRLRPAVQAATDAPPEDPAVAPGRLACAEQHGPRRGAHADPVQPAAAEVHVRGATALGRDALGPLPHLEVGLRPAPQVRRDVVAAGLADVLQPVQVEPVMGGAVAVDVEHPRARALAVDHLLAVEGTEGVGDRAALAAAGCRAEAVEVGADADAEEVTRVPVAADLAHVLGELIGPAVGGSDHAAQLDDALPGRVVGPGVAREHSRVALGLEQRHGLVAADGAHVVDVHDHLALHHAADEVRAQVGQALDVAMRGRRVHGHRPSREEVAEALAQQLVTAVAGGAGDLGLVARGPPAGLDLPELSGLVRVGRVDRRTQGARIERDTGQGVVELVDQLEVAHAHAVHLRELAIDLRPVALRHVVLHVAVEQLGDLDAQHHRELALVGHLAGLERAAHYAKPALARSAVEVVDVGLELADPPRLEAHAGHLVAAVALERIELAQHLVVHEQRRHHTQTAAPHALDPAVVGHLVGQRLRSRPALERGPATVVVGADGAAGGDDVLQYRAGAVARVVGAVLERLGHAAGVPRAPTVHRAPQELEAHPVKVALQDARDLGVRSAPTGGRAAHVDLGVGWRRGQRRAVGARMPGPGRRGHDQQHQQEDPCRGQGGATPHTPMLRAIGPWGHH